MSAPMAMLPPMIPTRLVYGRVLDSSSPEAKPYLDDWDEEYQCPVWKAKRYRAIARLRAAAEAAPRSDVPICEEPNGDEL